MNKPDDFTIAYLYLVGICFMTIWLLGHFINHI